MTGALRGAPEEVDSLAIEEFLPGSEARCLVRLVEDPLGRALCIPVMIARGAHPGPVLGVTAAVHGNELNGVPVIHRLFRLIDKGSLHGTLVGVPIVNVPAYMGRSRTLREGMDLNRMMPGHEFGNAGQQYAFRLRTRLIEQLHYLVDLHTASFGRVNSLYVRANLEHPVARRMAFWLGPEIVVHNPEHDGTLRGAAMAAGIPAITVEVGDPQRFQRRLIRGSATGILNVLAGLDFLPEQQPHDADQPMVCGRSRWIHAEHGGLLEVFPSVTERVHRGTLLARVTNVFGDVVADYSAPEDGVVVGKSTDPVCESGARIVHLGVETSLDEISVKSL